jgi:hypothetical protein
MCGIDYLACQGQLCVSNTLDVKGNDEHDLDNILHVGYIAFPDAMSLEFSRTLTVYYLDACLVIARISVSLFLRFVIKFTQFFVVSIAKSHQAKCTTLNKKM